MTKANANALFQGLKSQPSFTKAITIASGDPEETLLLTARREIRATLRETFGNFQPMLLPEDLRRRVFDNRDSRFQDASRFIKTLDIRFLTQGSYVYRTLNRPAQPAYQEIDLDDGAYVPMPFMDGRPIFSSDGLFSIIEQALALLVKTKGWGFQRKSTCIRMTLTGQNAHIDIPLSAVEEKAFQGLSILYERQLGTSFRKTATSLNEVLDSSARNLRLGKNSILLADRDEDWRPSDPKAIHDWFQDQVQRYGPVLRRACRYLKAWRDHTWQSCSLSSLTLMVACIDALDALKSRPAENRDDLIVLQIAETLATKFQAGGIVWRPGETPLDSKWSAEERLDFIQAAQTLTSEVAQALNNTFNREIVISRFRAVFGDRIPDAPEAIDIAAANQTKAVIETRPVSVAMPLVGTSVSA